MKKDLLGIADLTPEDIYLVLETAEAMREIGQRPIKKVPTLRGKTVVNLFYEPSTRTRTSFEIAEKRLSADTLNVAWPYRAGSLARAFHHARDMPLEQVGICGSPVRPDCGEVISATRLRSRLPPKPTPR